jgi:hypothetical protein
MESNKTLKLSAMLLGTMVVVGCQTDKSSMTDFFPQEEEHRVQNICDAQAASGARADATLQPQHFDGGKLNSLGQDKLDLMLKDDDTAQPMVVYLNLSDKDALSSARRDSVMRYLEDRGASADQIKLESGSNPHARSLSANHLGRMARTENVGTSSEGNTAPAGEPPATTGK